MPDSPDGDFLPTRHSLLSRLKDWDDQESWRDFFNTYWKLIYGVAMKAGLSETEAEEVVQETVISVAKKMKEFKYDPALGSFKGWLLQLTRWRITDQMRKRKPHEAAKAPASPDQPSRTATIERVPNPDGPALDDVWEQEWQQNLVDAALNRVKQQVSARQYQIFDCHVIKQWPVDKVARTLGVSATQVYLAKHRIGALVKKEVKRLETKFI